MEKAMKQKFLLLAFLVLGLQAFSQTGIKLYGYVRDEAPGMVRGNDESGRRMASPVHTTYFIYMVAPVSYRPQPSEIWIEHKRYAVTASVIKSPVVLNINGRNKTLVARTGQRVWQLTPSGDQFDGPTAAAYKNKAKSNDVVLVYGLKGRRQTATLKKLTRLEPKNNE